MFKWTSYDAIVLPVMYLLICVLGTVLHFALKNAKPFFRKLPLRILAINVVVAEIAKQIYYGCFEEFTYYVLPLHFCSLFLITMPVSQFCKERTAKYFKPSAFAFSLIVALLILVNPHALIGNSSADLFGSFHNAHTFFFHFSVVAYFVLSIALYDYKPQFKDCISLVCCILIYAAYAIPCAYLLNTNYVNIIYSEFAPLEKFRLWAGQFWYDALLIILSSAAVCLICVASTLIDKSIKISKKKIKTEP